MAPPRDIGDDSPRQISPLNVEEAISELKQELQQLGGQPSQRINCEPENIEQGLARLVLTLVELIRRLLERQAIRRMEGGDLTDGQVENMGQSLMTLEQKVHEMAAQFGLHPEELNLDLGPLGKLMGPAEPSGNNKQGEDKK